MSVIDEKIKTLLREKNKIEMLRSVQGFAGGLVDPAEHPGLADDVKNIVTIFINSLVSRIEKNSDTVMQPQTSASGHIGSEDLAAVHNIAQRLAEPMPSQLKDSSVEEGAKPTVGPLSSMTRDERKKFLLEYQTFAGRTVNFEHSTSKSQLRGTITRLNPPFLVVQTLGGEEYSVLPTQLEEQNEQQVENA